MTDFPSQADATKYCKGSATVVICASFVLLGALYFGLASCGGYLWKKQAFLAISTALYVAALSFPSSLLHSVGRKLAFAIGLPPLYIVLESATAPFYPQPPNSLAGYGAIFLQALKFGPCG